jgi:methionine sulfoxide reductase heme-binding subunit
MINEIIKSKYFLWMALFVPLIIISIRYYEGSLFYGEAVHLTGRISIQLMMFTMFISPFLLMFPKSTIKSWLLLSRRYFGVASFSFAFIHTYFYLVRVSSLEATFMEGISFEYLSGWLAMVIFLILALTSNNYSVNHLGINWKKLHRLIYLASILSFIHWLLIAFDPYVGMVHLFIMSLFEIYRIAKVRTRLRH